MYFLPSNSRSVFYAGMSLNIHSFFSPSPTVPPDTPVIEGQPIVTVTLGRPTNVTCRANNSRPGADVTWHMDSHRLTQGIYSRSVPQGGGKLVDSVGIVTINATKADSGKRLQCRAQNEAIGDPRTVTATINVQCENLF